MVTGIALGFGFKKITIMPFGFRIAFNKEQKEERKKILVAAAGPLINFCIMLIAIALGLHKNIIYSNLIIGIFNLLPIYPLDGGRILKLIIRKKVDKNKAFKTLNIITNITAVVITVIGSVLILYVKNMAVLFAIAYLWYFTVKENNKYKIMKRMYNAIEKNDDNIIKKDF